MKKIMVFFGILFFITAAHAFADGDQAVNKRLYIWKEYMVGTGGTNPFTDLWTFGSGAEYAFYRDDFNHEVTFSADLFNDRTVYGSQKLLMPVLANYRWYTGPRAGKGLYFSVGVGEAIPFGADHGTGSFAWQLSSGYVFSNRLSLAFRYIGRRSQIVTLNGVSSNTNGTFVGGMVDFGLWQ